MPVVLIAPAPMDRPALLNALRARLAGQAASTATARPAVPLAEGLPGLARAALHEVQAAAPGCGAALAALLLARSGGTALWIAGEDEPFPPGLARFGLAPAQLVLVRAAARADALWAMEEALRCRAVGGVVLALGQAAPPDLTASRRLQLAAEAGGGLGLLLRPAGGALAPCAAVSRWRVAPLPGGTWQLELLRARGGQPGGPWALRHAGEALVLLPGHAAQASA